MVERIAPTTPPGSSSTGPAAAKAAGTLGAAPGSATTDVRLEPAFELIGDSRVAVLSLDVFDTLLWRKVPEPVDAFVLLGLQLVGAGLLPTELDPGAFAVLRRRAEQRARERREARGRGVEVTLQAIWEQMPDQLFERMTRDEGIAAELELERSLLVPDLDVVQLVSAAQAAGKRVVGVSDTYFSESHLRSFLGTPPLAAIHVDRAFASSTYGIGKGSGLWRIVLEELGLTPRQLVHVGDNHDADVAVPSGLGIRTVYFERRPQALAEVIRRENLHAFAPLNPYHGDYGLTALRSKLLHRTEARDQPEQLRPFWDFGAACLGPALTGFAEWVHERAQGRGVTKLFCIMREGELLARLLNAAAAHLDSPIQAEPIWLSRQVCARASILDGSPEELNGLFVRRQMPTAAEFCDTLGLDVAEVPGFAERGEARLNQPGLPEELVERIAFDVGLRSRVVAGSVELRQRIARYVARLQPPDGGPLAVVDLGWGGSIQALLDGILEESGSGTRTLGFYLLTNDRAVDRILDGSEIHGFLANVGQPSRPVEAFTRSPEILEQICMPEHGSQIGLTAELEPVLDDHVETGLQAIERETVQRGVMACLREWGRYRTAAPGAVVPLHDGGQDQLRSILVRALTGPTLGEAELFGAWLHDENFGSAGVETLVPSPSPRAARYVDPQGLLEIPWSELYWPFGLAALHDEDLPRAIEAASAGVVRWEAFSSPLDTGPVEIYVDRGWGFRRDGAAIVDARRNRLGLSYARGTVTGDVIRRVRLDPAKAPCVVRLDWIRLRCHRRGAQEPVVLDFDRPEQLKRLTLHGMRQIAPKTFLVEGADPNVIADLRELVAAEVHTADVECGFALLELPPSRLQRRLDALKAKARARVRGGRLGGPIRAAYSLLRRID